MSRADKIIEKYAKNWSGDTDNVEAWELEDLTSTALQELGADFDRDPEGWKPYMSHEWLRPKRQI